jgi:hypothetical protein
VVCSSTPTSKGNSLGICHPSAILSTIHWDVG